MWVPQAQADVHHPGKGKQLVTGWRSVSALSALSIRSQAVVAGNDTGSAARRIRPIPLAQKRRGQSGADPH